MLDETVEKKTAASSSQETLLRRETAQSLVEKSSQGTFFCREKLSSNLGWSEKVLNEVLSLATLLGQ